MTIKILNSSDPDLLQYLPYGVTTLEMKMQGDPDKLYGSIYPKRVAFHKYKHYAGFADSSEDFLIIWGGGSEKGLQITSENIHSRLFLQILHIGDVITDEELTLLHDNFINPIIKIRFLPAERSDPVRMFVERTNPLLVKFKGSSMPNYYSRWFPPGGEPSYQSIIYNHDIIPDIKINFDGNKEKFGLKVKSDLKICIGDKQIAEIRGDWRHSYFLGELFSIQGDYVVLRCWFYWIHKNFRSNSLLKLTAKSNQKGNKSKRTERNFLISQDVEVPDIERFDFVIDTKINRIVLMGTDFHYQELWYVFKNADLVKAIISNDFDTIGQVVTKLRNRVKPRDHYNPMDVLDNILRNRTIQELSVENIKEEIDRLERNEYSESQNVTTYRGPGAFRKHIPFTKNGQPVAGLVSSIVTH